jgi:hypothetical protein
MTNLLYEILWISQPFLKLAIVFFMYRRKLHLRFPIFFSFVIFGIVENLLLYVVHFGAYATYFYTYWTVSAISVMLGFGIIYEAFTGMFRQHHGLRDFGSILFQWSGVVVVMMAFMMVSSAKTGGGSRQIIETIISMERSEGVMQCGLLLLLLLFAKHLGITVRHHLFGIVLGLGAYATVDVIMFTQRALFTFSGQVFNLMHMAAFDCALITWLTYMLLPQPAEALPNLLLRPQRWSDALMHAANPVHENPVMMGIEDIVDRALTKTNGGRHKTGS